MAAVDLGALKAQPNPTNRSTVEPIVVDAAFMVVIREGGLVQASPDINAPIAPRREVTMDEMGMAARRIYDDIQASKTAQIVQMGMQQAAQMAYSQVEGQRIAQSLKI